jgi:hypothetical protein
MATVLTGRDDEVVDGPLEVVWSAPRTRLCRTKARGYMAHGGELVFAAGADRNSPPRGCVLVRTVLLHHLVVCSEDQERRRPLTHKQSILTPSHYFESQGRTNRTHGCPQKQIRRKFCRLFFYASGNPSFAAISFKFLHDIYLRLQFLEEKRAIGIPKPLSLLARGEHVRDFRPQESFV